MSLWRSIELRLTAWYALVLFFGFLVLGIVLWSVVSYSLQASIDHQLLERGERLVATVTAELEEDDEEDRDEIAEEIEEELVEFVMGLPEGNLAQIRNEDGEQVFPTDGPEPAIHWREGRVEPSLDTAVSGSTSYRVLVQDISIVGRHFDILLASSLEGISDTLHRIVTLLVVVTPIVLLLSCGGGFYIAHAALRPVDEITETAAKITVGNLSQRIPSYGTGDALERLATTVNAMLERIEISVSKIEQFSADASHELRTPISVVRTTAELALRYGRTEEGYRSDPTDIQHESERLSDLIEVLLTLSRGGENEKIPMTPVDLGQVVSEVHTQYRSEAERKGLSFEIRLPRANVVVEGNDAALRRMLGHLVENALAHTQAGSISLSLEREGGAVRLRVTDTGEGIPEVALDRIFDRFYRADSSRSRRSERHGLGLSITRRLAELHGAYVTVESREGEGAEFTVHFPDGEP